MLCQYFAFAKLARCPRKCWHVLGDGDVPSTCGLHGQHPLSPSKDALDMDTPVLFRMPFFALNRQSRRMLSPSIPFPTSEAAYAASSPSSSSLAPPLPGTPFHCLPGLQAEKLLQRRDMIAKHQFALHLTRIPWLQAEKQALQAAAEEAKGEAAAREEALEAAHAARNAAAADKLQALTAAEAARAEVPPQPASLSVLPPSRTCPVSVAWMRSSSASAPGTYILRVFHQLPSL